MVDLAAQNWRDFNVDGVAASGKHEPVKSSIRSWGTWVEGYITAFNSNGGLIYTTRALMNADLLHGANSSAWVIGDPVVANNGIYRKSGISGAGAWTRTADLPYSFISCADAGAGTANALVLTSAIPAPSAARATIFISSAFEANTGAVTIALNGASAKPLLTVSGGALSNGYLTSGTPYIFVDDGAQYRLITDVASAGVVAAAEAAAAAAEAAAASVTSRVVSLPIDITTTTLGPTAPYIAVLNQYSDAVISASEWVRAVGNVEPTHALKRQTADGIWMELSAARGVGEFDPRHFGQCAHLGNATVAWQAMLDLIMFKGAGVIKRPPGRFYFDQPLARTFTSNLANVFGIHAEDRYASEYVFDGASITGSGNKLLGFEQGVLGINSRVHISRQQILIDGVIDGTAIVTKRPAGGIGPTSTVTLEQNIVRGLSNNGDYITNGYDYSGQFFCFIRENEFHGDSYTGGALLPYDDSHPFYQADLGFNADNTYGGVEIGNVSRYVKFAFRSKWPDAYALPTGEGMERMFNRAGVCLRGHEYSRPSPEPANRWHSNYVDARDAGFIIQGCHSAKFTDNESYIYASNGIANLSQSPVNNTTPVDFYFKGCYDLEIVGSKHRGQDIRKAAYVFDPLTTPAAVTINPREMRVRQPSFEGYSGHSLFRAYALSTDGRIESPKICANSSITNLAFGNHNASEWGVFTEDRKLVVLGLSAVQSIPNSTVTSIAWSSEDRDDYGAHVANSAIVTVPSNKGIRSFRAKFQGSYNAAGAVGQRQFELFKAGTLVPYGFSDIGPASQPYRTGQYTEILPCVAGEQIEVRTNQNSGSAQDLAVGQTFLIIEWLGEKGI